MPVCKKCGSDFPNWLYVEGKRRQLCRRKFCLTCSPFGRHNTRDITQINKETGTDLKPEYTCASCGKVYIYQRQKGTTKTLCGSCLSTRHRIKIKQWAITYKGGKCYNCDYNRCISALHFHHLDPLQKDFAISGSQVFSLRRIAQELDKCVLLCANCHAEVHAGMLVLKQENSEAL